MNWNARIRRAHRWLALVFTATIVVTVVALAAGGPAWVSYVPLPPLFLLLFSGLYLLVSWFAASRRADAAPRTAGRALVRQVHRWSAVVFLITVLATFAALAPADPIVWVSYLPLLPLAVLLFSGLYMIVRTYAARRTDPAAAPSPAS